MAVTISAYHFVMGMWNYDFDFISLTAYSLNSY